MLTTILFSRSTLLGTISGLLEGIGLPWPGIAVLAGAGAEFRSLAAAVAVGTLFAIAYTAASLVQYLIGRYSWPLFERFLSAQMQRQLNQTLKRYGEGAVFWTRPLAIGNYMSIPAGIMRMHPAKFILYTFLGKWIWAVGITAAGNYLGAYMEHASTIFALLAVAMVAKGLFSFLRKSWKKAPEDATTLGD